MIIDFELRIKANHKHLGKVVITEHCFALKSYSTDPDTFFVEHEGEIKEVTKSLISLDETQDIGEILKLKLDCHK